MVSLWIGISGSGTIRSGPGKTHRANRASGWPFRIARQNSRCFRAAADPRSLEPYAYPPIKH